MSRWRGVVMTTMRVASDLAAVMVPIGYAGAVIAGICAIVAAVAIVRGAGGLTGGAVGVWFVGALMSVLASFARDWMPLIVACALLVGLLIIGGVVRAIVSASGVERTHRDAAEPGLPPVPAAKASTVGTATGAKPVRTTTASVAVVR